MDEDGPHGIVDEQMEGARDEIVIEDDEEGDKEGDENEEEGDNIETDGLPDDEVPEDEDPVLEDFDGILPSHEEDEDTRSGQNDGGEDTGSDDGNRNGEVDDGGTASGDAKAVEEFEPEIANRYNLRPNRERAYGNRFLRTAWTTRPAQKATTSSSCNKERVCYRRYERQWR